MPKASKESIGYHQVDTARHGLCKLCMTPCPSNEPSEKCGALPKKSSYCSTPPLQQQSNVAVPVASSRGLDILINDTSTPTQQPQLHNNRPPSKRPAPPSKAAPTNVETPSAPTPLRSQRFEGRERNTGILVPRAAADHLKARFPPIRNAISQQLQILHSRPILLTETHGQCSGMQQSSMFFWSTMSPTPTHISSAVAVYAGTGL